MSLYEVLVIVALAAAGGYAYSLYRSDARAPKNRETEATGELMFGKAPGARVGDGKDPVSKSETSGDARK